MEELYRLLKDIGCEAQKKVKEELSGPTGGIKALVYNLITPMVLNFQTELESYHFIFHKGGSISLHQGLHMTPDVTVSSEQAELVCILRDHDKKRFERDEQVGKIKIHTRSLKGRQAVTKLRELFL
ncbi:MAG: hypothetical protein EFT35_10200 [Methanophagales archaeon ANME-1-THS]|nr:MAG: hypothetical protein EFT35_10200 [Methanophagales archaeon ANME-1-THS]